MKYSIIAPIYDLELTPKISGDYFMILSWLLKEKIYYDFYKKYKEIHPKSFYILDNGAAEDKLMSNKQLIEMADYIKANEIVLPDVYGDGVKTIDLVTEFIDENCDRSFDYKLMGVLQGQNKEEILKCLEFYINCPYINTIGVGYRNLLYAFSDDIGFQPKEYWTELKIPNIDILSNKLEDNTYLYTLSRVYLLKNYIDFKLLKNRKKKIHLLGIWNSIEMSFYNKVFNKEELKIIRGCDSAALCQAAQKNIIWNKEYGVVNKPVKYLDFFKKMSPNELFYFNENVKILKEWMK
jgi:hypothetical protein